MPVRAALTESSTTASLRIQPRLREVSGVLKVVRASGLFKVLVHRGRGHERRGYVLVLISSLGISPDPGEGQSRTIGQAIHQPNAGFKPESVSADKHA
jgi:hypothetical protein